MDMLHFPNAGPRSASSLRKLVRHTPASTLFVGSSQRRLLRSPLSEHALLSSGQPVKPLHYKKSLRSTRESLRESRQRKRLARRVSERAFCSLQQTRAFSQKLKRKEAKLNRVQLAVAKTEEQSEELKRKIRRFESLFCKLYDSLEDGNDNVRRLSDLIGQELNAPVAADCEPLQAAATTEVSLPLSQQLETVKHRTASLFHFLRLRKQ